MAVLAHPARYRLTATKMRRLLKRFAEASCRAGRVEVAIASLGERWRIADPGLLVKRYPVCSSALAGIEQALP